MKWIRWKAVWPLSVVSALVAMAWWFLLDPVVKWGVEDVGARIVGAKVDLREADVRVAQGVVSLHGLQVTDPDAPMTNLFEAEDIVVNVRIPPLLEHKLVVDTVAVRGLRFGTPRTTSGALADRGEASTSALQVARDWVRQVQVPPIALGTLTQVVNVQGIAAESLSTLRAALHARAYADTARAQLLGDLQGLNPRPTIDSAAALAQRLQTANLRTLGLTGARQAATDVRASITALTQLDDRLRGFEAEVRGGAAGLAERIEAIPAARAADYAYARRLLQLPTFDVPALGPQLFSAPIAEQMSRLLYWVQMAERYVPPGIQRSFREGPSRVRASGTTVDFPREATYPAFLLRLAELSLTLGGNSAAAGEYAARMTGVTTQPSVYGAPTTFLLERTAARVGPSDIRIAGLLDHVTAALRDTIGARLVGVSLPTLPLPGLGATVQLGTGTTELQLQRRGDSLGGRWLWRATAVRWARDTTVRAPSVLLRTVEDAIWRAVSRLDSVEIEARFSGTIAHPVLGIHTNVASAVANALRDQLGDEIRRAEAQVRARVDELVSARVAEARAQAEMVRTEVTDRVAAERVRLQETKAVLEARLRDLVRIPGIG